MFLILFSLFQEVWDLYGRTVLEFIEHYTQYLPKDLLKI